jgi:hypothetical protein
MAMFGGSGWRDGEGEDSGGGGDGEGRWMRDDCKGKKENSHQKS